MYVKVYTSFPTSWWCRDVIGPSFSMHVLGLDKGGDSDSVVVPSVRHRANMANLPAVTPFAVVCCCYILASRRFEKT